MPRRKLTLVTHLSSLELKKRYRSCRNAKEARRWHVLWLISQGALIKEAAETVGLGYSWVREVVKRYNDRGPQSVIDQHRFNPGGANPRLNAQQIERLKETLRRPPPDGGLWTGPKVADWITQVTGKKTYPQLGWAYLHDLDPELKINRSRQTRSVRVKKRTGNKMREIEPETSRDNTRH